MTAREGESDTVPALFSERLLCLNLSGVFFWLDTYHLSFLGGRYKIPRDRGDALHINNSTEHRVYCINIEGSGLLHIQLHAQTLHRTVGISSLYVQLVRHTVLTILHLQYVWKIDTSSLKQWCKLIINFTCIHRYLHSDATTWNK